MPLKLNNGGHFQEYDPYTGEYMSGSENDDRDRLKNEPRVIEAKNKLLQIKSGAEVNLPFPKEYLFDKEYAQQYIYHKIETVEFDTSNVDLYSIRFIAFDNDKLIISAKTFTNEIVLYKLGENGELIRIILSEGDKLKNIVAYGRAYEYYRTEDTIELMEKLNLNFSKQNVIFATRDSNGEITWLEEGNNMSGLLHILYGKDGVSGHRKDFFIKHHVNESELSHYLFDLFTNGKVLNKELKIRNGRETFDKMIYYLGNYFIAGVGTNGYIVSIFPIESKIAKKKIWRLKNE